MAVQHALRMRTLNAARERADKPGKAIDLPAKFTLGKWELRIF